ncbi:MAG: SH3 domain-containing protein [Anaerolineales bacterium]|jgi:hypothetical protein
MSFTPNTISQRDPGWINEKLGFDTSLTIGTDGSTLVCLTMLVNGYGFSETPYSLNQKLKEMGSGVGFLDSLIVWPGLTEAFPGIVYRGIIICRDQSAPISDINASIDAGQPLVIEIDESPSAGLQNHWVVIYARQGDDYLMLDPWPEPPDQAPTFLSTRYGSGRSASEFITAVAWYDAGGNPAPAPATASDTATTADPVTTAEPITTPDPATTPEPATTPSPGTGLFVRVQAAVTAGLTLRSAPSISATTVALETPGTLLHCNEPDAVALAKIGVMDQWLQVSDPGGLNGYMAAWYVKKVAGTSSAPLPAPAPAPAPTPPDPTPTPAPAPIPISVSPTLTVLVLQSIGVVGLRLRDQPETNASTLAILSGGQALTVLEPTSQAIPKIGQINQWLNVNDGNGHTGYVAAWYVESGTTPSTPPPPQSPQDTKTLTVLVSSQASAGLRLRDQPNANAVILKVLMPGTPLTVLEPASTARARIGVTNQWLNVQEPGGTTGYIAAWFVTG